MGVVYRANQPALGRAVALKVIRSGGFATDAEKRRFRNEAEAVAQLDHPHIVPIFEVGDVRGHHYFSMKLVEGSGLDRRIDSFVGDPRGVARLVATIAGAVHHAHERGILHRDLGRPTSSSTRRGRAARHRLRPRPRRLDAARLDLTHSRAPSSARRPTCRASRAGRWALRDGFTTATDDLRPRARSSYALPDRPAAAHAGTSLAETLDLVREAPPEPPSWVNAEVPRDLETICLKCLEKDPQRRSTDRYAGPWPTTWSDGSTACRSRPGRSAR